MARLSHADVEKRIREMWEALEGLEPPEAAPAWDQAKVVERDLRSKLAAQDRLDAAGPKMLEALKALYAISFRLSGCSRRPCAGCEENERARSLARAAIDLAEKG